eukprot:scaffold53913_cov67-Phaeocystis_antarctica.AAC.2
MSRPQLRSGILAAGRSLLSEETRSISPRAGAPRRDATRRSCRGRYPADPMVKGPHISYV